MTHSSESSVNSDRQQSKGVLEKVGGDDSDEEDSRILLSLALLKKRKSFASNLALAEDLPLTIIVSIAYIRGVWDVVRR